MANKAPKKHIFSRLQIKVRPKGIHSLAFYILIFTFSLTSYGISNTKEQVRKNKLFLQNKANFQKVKLNVSDLLIRKYAIMDTWSIRKNEPKTNPNEPKLKKAKMNVTSYITKEYENISNWAICENEPNTKPNKPNFRGKKSRQELDEENQNIEG